MADQEEERFQKLVNEAREIKLRVTEPSLAWYRGHSTWPFVMFRGAGVLTILLSVSLPAVVNIHFRHRDLVISIVSVTIAALTGLATFYRWERTWKSRRVCLDTLEQLCSQWDLEMVNAELVLQGENRGKHVYDATSDLIAKVRLATASESESFFGSLQMPMDRAPK